MKLARWKRAVLAGLLTLSVAGGALATTTAADAHHSCDEGYRAVHLSSGGWYCFPN